MNCLQHKSARLFTLIFLLIELILYYLILTTGGTVLIWASWLSILFCFLHSLGSGRGLLIGGLACTVAADYFLVLCSPIQQLWGMCFFLTAQTLYAVKLHLSSRSKALLILRLSLVALAELLGLLILKKNLDALAAVSLCYYANLIVNIIESFTLFRQDKLFPIGLVLFLLCDTVIGLQAASGVYLQIPEGSLIARIIFMDFHLSWFFYLPSQVLISLSSKFRKIL